MSKKAKKADPELSREPIVTTVNGWPRYECPVCGRDSDSLSTITDHIDGHFPTWLGADNEEVAADGAAADHENGVRREVSGGVDHADDDGGGRDQS